MYLDTWGIFEPSRGPFGGLNTGRPLGLLGSWLGGVAAGLVGVFRVYFWAVGLGCHEDSECPVEDPPLGVRYEDMDGGLFGGRVQGVPRCDGNL